MVKKGFWAHSASLFIILVLGVVLAGKLLYNNASDNMLLYVYGGLVTLVTLMVFAITFTQYKDPYFEAQKIPAEKKKQFFVSCMVAVRNEEDILRQCIESFLVQTYKQKEIIFVNDASTDGTKAILDEYARKGVIKVIHLGENVGKKKALAKAMLVAKGELFAFSDSDSIWAPDAMERAVEVFNVDPMIGGMSGHCRVLNAEKNMWTKIQDSWYEGQYSVRKAFESIYGAVTCVSGPMAVFRKEAIYNFIPAWEHDRFLGSEFRFATDRTLTGYVLGSKYVGKKLKKKYTSSPFLKVNYPLKDWKIVYCKSARAWTQVPDTFRKILRQQVRWKKSFVRNTFFTGRFYWRKPLFPAVGYYAHIVFVIVGPLIAFRHLVYLPVRGNVYSAVLYLAGVVLIGALFGLAYKMEDRKSSRWVYRPLMSLLSTFVLAWLLPYSVMTIKKKTWRRN